MKKEAKEKKEICRKVDNWNLEHFYNLLGTLKDGKWKNKLPSFEEFTTRWNMVAKSRSDIFEEEFSGKNIGKLDESLCLALCRDVEVAPQMFAEMQKLT